MFDDDPNQSTAATSRVLHLALVAVIGLAVVGFFVGIRQGTTVPDISQREPTPVDPHPNAIPATAYRNFDRRALGRNTMWKNSLASLAQPGVDLFEVPQRTDELRRTVLAARAERRAFDGAPPVVPHPIDQMSTASCVACHGEGLAIGKGVHAPMMSHAFMPNCTQCHAEQFAADLETFVLAENDFEGKQAPFGGNRAWQGAPPVIPHATFMRENCMSCHGPSGAKAIRTSHPWRNNCLQCHAPSATLDQVQTENRQTRIKPLEVAAP